MPKGTYFRCQIFEWDIGKWCRLKATAISYIDEPYYSLHDELSGMKRTQVPLCKSHYDWIHRSRELYELDYDDWLEATDADV